MAGDDDRTTEVEAKAVSVPTPVTEEASVPTAIVPEHELERLVQEAGGGALVTDTEISDPAEVAAMVTAVDRGRTAIDPDDAPTVDQSDTIEPVRRRRAAGKTHSDHDDDDIVTDVVSAEALAALDVDGLPVEDELDEGPTEIAIPRPSRPLERLELPLAPDDLEATGVVNIEDVPATGTPLPMDEPAEPPTLEQSAVASSAKLPANVETEPVPKVASGSAALLVAVLAIAAAAVILWLVLS